MGADGKSAEIRVKPLLTIEPDTDNAVVGKLFSSALRYMLWLNFLFGGTKNEKQEKFVLVS